MPPINRSHDYGLATRFLSPWFFLVKYGQKSLALHGKILIDHDRNVSVLKGQRYVWSGEWCEKKYANPLILMDPWSSLAYHAYEHFVFECAKSSNRHISLFLLGNSWGRWIPIGWNSGLATSLRQTCGRLHGAEQLPERRILNALRAD